MVRVAIVYLLFGLRALAGETVLIEAARSAYGNEGGEAASYLVRSMPEGEVKRLTEKHFVENIGLALQARREFDWARKVPKELFLNDVLPYAVFDETREEWRGSFLELARPLVKGAGSASEAAQRLNRDFFNAINVHYDTGRKAPNQSPSESMAIGKATCTGLSIILVNACRAVGIPARAVGTMSWSNDRGNHTWVEIWDGQWKFLGADEYDPAGLNRGWFVDEASKATSGSVTYGIYATSWNGKTHFPMVWAPESKTVGAVEVTERYTGSGSPDDGRILEVTVVEDGVRIETDIWVVSLGLDILASGKTRAHRADLNDFWSYDLSRESGEVGSIIYRDGDRLLAVEAGPVPEKGDSRLITIERGSGRMLPKGISAFLFKPQGWQEVRVNRDEKRELYQVLRQARRASEYDAREAELLAKKLSIGGKTLRWKEKKFGEAPDGERSLWISLHGGGGAPPEVNDKQWENQINLYQPEEGFYVAPRAPGNTWDLWHTPDIDGLIDQLISNYVLQRGVSPNRVYLMGYSAGGDGVYQLAPRMADRFAAAAMMAGHPNDASLLNLRNLPFAILMGGDDEAYDRNQVARQKGDELKTLAAADPGGYEHFVRIYEGLGHWMKGKDREVLPWMARKERNPWPKKLVWVQDNVTHLSFYWLELPTNHSPRPGDTIRATVNDQTVSLIGDVPVGLKIWLSPRLLDLEKPITIVVNSDEPQVVTAVSRVGDFVGAVERWPGREFGISITVK